MIEIANLELSYLNLTIIIFATFIIGLTRGGIHGLATATIPFFADILGPRTSTAYIALLFCTGDIIAIIRYHKNIDFKILLKIIPLALLGIISATIIGTLINETVFKIVLCVIVVYTVINAVLKQVNTKNSPPKKEKHFLKHSMYGLLGGFTSMIGNASGSLMTSYFLSLNISKKNYLGTYTAFFLFMNSTKVMVHSFVWKTITVDIIKFDLILVPILITGVFSGILIAKNLQESLYKKILIVIMVFSALQMILSTLNTVLIK